MFSILVILILWTWGLTPLWVNLTGTILLGLRMMAYILKLVIGIVKENKND